MKKKWMIGLGMMWAIAFGVGAYLMLIYSYAPGIKGDVAKFWPQTSSLSLDKTRHTIVLHLHPQCPCSRATLNELAKILAEVSGKATIYGLFYLPSEAPSTWTKSALWDDFSSMRGTKAFLDSDGTEAKKFGAQTSGQTFVYNSKGQLLFNGGITAARGHEGDNLGQNAVIAHINGGQNLASETPVFGCHLFKSLHKFMPSVKEHSHDSH